MAAPDYFREFEHRRPPDLPPLGAARRAAWWLLSSLALGLGGAYLGWRWTASINPDALAFSAVVALAETLAFAGLALFVYDTWDEGDTPPAPPPGSRADLGLDGAGPVRVDIYIATYDEALETVAPSIADAHALRVPPGCTATLHLLDDGNRPAMARLAKRTGIHYHARSGNRGFKAGNLRQALLRSDGDFVVICDADTRLFPSFLENTLGYFRDPSVSWVQTPHWFYDVPEGRPLAALLPKGRLRRLANRLLPRARVGRDPFLSAPMYFFDVIQRRRNRHGASFCCGAGSIHRVEAVAEAALARRKARLETLERASAHLGPRPPGTLRRMLELQPFRYHVSEDLLTSMEHHAAGWRSVYHPRVEARMLSPWSMDAWILQKLKYAGGTMDILLREAPRLLPRMPLPVAAHYLATFWSYLSCLWLPVLLLAPALSLLTGASPVRAYTVEFFLHLLPFLLVLELAMLVGAKGQDAHAGRVLQLALLPVHLRAIGNVLRGRKPNFVPTPKVPGRSRAGRHVRPTVVILALYAAAALWGLGAAWRGAPGYGSGFLVVNLFWLGWNAVAVARPLVAAFWRPPATRNNRQGTEDRHDRAPQTA